MSQFENDVIDHYRSQNLIGNILKALTDAGKDLGNLTIDDIGVVDEFHIGGRVATQFVVDSLALKPSDHVLDIGCGIGGPARVVAQSTDCTVTGIDLVPDYIEAAQRLNSLTGLADQVNCQTANALDLPFRDAQFDAVFSVHVAMNIEDREALYRETARVLKPGGIFCAYDVMKTGDTDISFPVPWASTSSESFLISSKDMQKHLEENGMHVESITDKGQFALDFFDKVQARQKAQPSGLGLHMVMGATTKAKITNIRTAISQGSISPILMTARKR
jgi:ubiquinone/menaquinone biosynthesis C-methylase UbiE